MKIITDKLCASFVTVFAVILVSGSATAETISFEGIPAGTILDEVFSDEGAGPIRVNAVNVDLDTRFAGPNNAAVVFDSSNPAPQIHCR